MNLGPEQPSGANINEKRATCVTCYTLSCTLDQKTINICPDLSASVAVDRVRRMQCSALSVTRLNAVFVHTFIIRELKTEKN